MKKKCRWDGVCKAVIDERNEVLEQTFKKKGHQVHIWKEMSIVSSKFWNRYKTKVTLKQRGQSSDKTLYRLVKSKQLKNREGLLHLLQSEQEISLEQSNKNCSLKDNET
jgi:hypothetical protein